VTKIFFRGCNIKQVASFARIPEPLRTSKLYETQLSGDQGYNRLVITSKTFLTVQSDLLLPSRCSALLKEKLNAKPVCSPKHVLLAAVLLLLRMQKGLQFEI
jgi:hypothetical protein